MSDLETVQKIGREYVKQFGSEGLRNMLRCFGKNKQRITQLGPRQLDMLVANMTREMREGQDKHMRQPSKDGRKMERIWITNDGRHTPISEMDDDHLHNTILFVDRMLDRGAYRVGANEDLADMLNELEDERIFRDLHLPLVPIKTLKFRKGENR